MQFDDVTHDSQAESRPSVSSGGRAVALAESIEDIRQKIRVNTNARIGNGDLDMIAGLAQCNLDCPTFVGELDCV